MITADAALADVGFAVVDIETTGLRAGFDRIVELSVVHVGMNEPPSLAFDSLLKPRRALEQGTVHGIRSIDLTTAPTLAAVAGNVERVLANRIVVAHNAAFDLRFLDVELERVGMELQRPYLDTLGLVPLLGVGPRAALGQLRLHMNLPTSPFHIAAEDAMAAATLLVSCLRVLRERGVRLVGELTQIEGFDLASGASLRLPLPVLGAPRVEGIVQSRAARLGWVPGDVSGSRPAASYADALLAALSDCVLSEEELDDLERIRDDVGIFGDDLRAVHAHALAWLLERVAADQVVTGVEERHVGAVMRGLARLGWAPKAAAAPRRRAEPA